MNRQTHLLQLICCCCTLDPPNAASTSCLYLHRTQHRWISDPKLPSPHTPQDDDISGDEDKEDTQAKAEFIRILLLFLLLFLMKLAEVPELCLLVQLSSQRI